jgi:hypothetical protein
MYKLYRFNWDCGRMGEVEGVFVADEKEVQKAIGKGVYFGEILGKHSEIWGTLGEEDLTVISDDWDFVQKILSDFGTTLISGYNPLYYLDEEYDDED